jgi:hypothetical protein
MTPKRFALLTDFGQEDTYVGQLHGVLHRLSPGCKAIDLTHHCPSGDIPTAAFRLLTALAAFAPDTCFLCVVDPGVGTDRRALAAQSKRGFFVGPDNGLFDWVFAKDPPLWVVALHESQSIQKLLTPAMAETLPCSRTFHGRDWFAPAAACLAKGLPPEKLGKSISTPQPQIRLPLCLDLDHMEEPHTTDIIDIDHFGNVILRTRGSEETTGSGSFPKTVGSETLAAHLPNGQWIEAASHYGAVSMGQALLLVGSHGFFEIALNGDHAAKRLQLYRGQSIQLIRRNQGVC